jgi:hypothetical protein
VRPIFPPFLGLGGDRLFERRDGGDEALSHADCGGDIHRRGKRVVRRLRQVHVIVRVHGRLAAERGAGKLAAAVGDHLVDVHVELRPAAGHPDMQREIIGMLPGEYFVANRDDHLAASRVQRAELAVGERRRLFEDRVRGDHLARHQIAADAEIFERALGLRAP